MLNVNQLTEQLRMMPDQALQRMAQMYKNDPYILPMLISEDTARKKLRQAAQAQAAQPQPKVVDQAVAAMGTPPQPAPGIAALQAPNMERMADGGIAGYAEGGVADTAEDAFSRGGMFDFSQRSEPVVRMAGGGVPGYADRGLVQTTADTLSQVQAPVMENLQNLKAQLTEAERVLAAAARSGDAASVTQYAQAVQQLRDQINAVAERTFGNRAQQVVGELRSPPSNEAIMAAYGPGADRMPQVQTPSPVTPAAPPSASAAPSAPSSRAPSAGTGAPAAPADGGIYSLAGRLFDPIEARTRAQLGRMRMAAQQRSEGEQAAFEAGKPKGQVGEGLEALLKKEAEGEAGERENAKALAIFNAGLAMMAGGSPRALENIAKGAMVGTGQYAEAMKDFKKAAKERQKMLANIEEARRAEARDDNKTALSLLQRANDNENKMEMFALDATTTLGFKKADLTGRLYGSQMEQEGAMARVRAQDPLALYRALDPTGKGNIAKGFEAAQTAKREPMTKQALFLEYMKNPLNDPAKFGEYVQQYERQFGPIGSSSGSASQSADTSGFKVVGVRNP